MCDSIRFHNGEEIQTVRQFQNFFKVDAKKYGWDGECIDCCMCGLDLEKFFKDNPDFYYDCGEWWEK